MRTLQRISLFAALALLIVVPGNIFSCGPFFDEATFSFARHPDYPLKDYLQGKLGVVRRDFYRTYLVVAYRVLSGHPFNPREIAALDPLLTSEAQSNDAITSYGMDDNPGDQTPPPPSPSALWLTARNQALGLAPPPQPAEIDPNKPLPNYENFLNCPSDAFTTAIATLHDREKRWGANSADLKSWIAGQDAVFANCSGHALVEPPALTSSNKLLQQDRAYQHAAALFYSGNVNLIVQAAREFEAISNDASSPWRAWAAYVEARCFIRASTLSGKGDQAFDPQLMQQAETALFKLHADKNFAPVYAAADKLLGFVEARLHPDQRMHEVAEKLIKGTSSDIAQDFIDYRYFMDQTALQTAEAPKEDLTDWIATFQNAPNQKDHALEKWRATRSLPWLIAALSAVGPKDAATGELLAAAEKTNPRDPRLLTVLYDRVVLTSAAGKVNEVNRLVDANLPYLAHEAPISARNLFWHERLETAQTFDDFLRFAPREDAAGHHAQAHLDPNRPAPPNTPNDVYFDTDATAIFNERLPLAMLADAAASPRLTKPLEAEIAQAAWTRALILNQPAEAAKVAATVKQSVPALAAPVDDYAKAADADARHRAALLILLRNPGLKPFVAPNMQRETPVTDIGNYEERWWCADVGAKQDTTNWGSITGDAPETPETPKTPVPTPAFLTPAEKAAGEAQWTGLAKIGAAPDYLAAETLAWAQAAPDDPRIPEALHLVVRATRYGCTDDKTSAFSKQAFALLHKRYPNNEWTKKTPYYF